MRRSTKSSLFPDVNVWLALTYEAHVHHAAAASWLAGAGRDARLFFCRITQLSLLRLLTTEAIMGKEVLHQRNAWRVYDRWLKDERIALLPEPAELDRSFRRFTRSRLASPKDWADSYLAAFASRARLTLVTFDQGLHRRVRQSILLPAEDHLTVAKSPLRN
jgi:toxin-antitoxin system PIN domain toxin